MSGLVEFLRARLDEDEAAARGAAHAERADTWTTIPDSYGGVLDATGNRSLAVGYGDVMAPETAIHIARHDPARVLAEVEAKRQIVRVWESLRLLNEDGGYELAYGTASKALQLHAAVYADHPDYEERWRP